MATKRERALTMAEIEDFTKALGLSSFDVVKKSAKCVIVETSDYFYKVLSIDFTDPSAYFQNLLNEAYALEYKKNGLDWSYFVCKDKQKTYAVEKREKLKVLRPGEVSLEAAVNSAYSLTRNVERRLGFPQLTSQVRQAFGYDSVERVCVARDAEESYDDFAWFGKDVVELGTSNRFLALIGSGNRFHRHHSAVVNVQLKGLNCYFAPMDIQKEYDKIAENLYLSLTKWWIYSEQFGKRLVAERRHASSDLAKINSTNVKILTTKQLLPVRSREDQKEESNFSLAESQFDVLNLDEGVAK